MTTLEDFFVEGEDVYIDGDIRIVDNARIIGGSLTVKGNIILDHANLTIKDGDLTAWEISSKHCDNISVEGSICTDYGIYVPGCIIDAYNIYTTCLNAGRIKVLFDILFVTGNLKELYCERDCYIEEMCNLNNGILLVAGKFQGAYVYNINNMSIGCGSFLQEKA